MYFAGVDLGSTAAKVVIMDSGILASVVGPTGAEHRRTAYKVMAEALERADLGLDDLDYIVATGYGRLNVPFADRQITEITCHARGVGWLFPSATGVIDIGGQDSKGIRIAGGKVVDFVMNDKCAAGTGRFLEVISDALGLSVERIGEISLGAENPVKISNVCTVFAEQEVIGHLSNGAKVEDILAGLHASIAGRLDIMFARLKMQGDIVVTGGGALNIGLLKALEKQLGQRVLTPQEPQLTGALGAALSASDLIQQASAMGRTLAKGPRQMVEASFYT